MTQKRQRTDADRRIRQSERLGRLLRLLTLIMGKGRWDAQSLAEELECSKRTVHRLLQALTTAGVPWYFDEGTHSYRVRSGFQMKGLDLESQPGSTVNQRALKQSAQAVMADSHRFLESLQKLIHVLDGQQ